MTKIDIISGFLGAGKTTFANKLLRYYVDIGLRPVYIVNEIGQAVLDADILRAEGFEAYEMEGGCICCSLKDDVGNAILEVVKTFSPTNIVFEPSGIFIFDNFFDILKNPEIREQCEIANVLTIVDGLNFSFAKAKYGSFIYNQIKSSATILLSKLEKTRHSVDELICDVRNINPDAYIISKIWSEWDTEDYELLLSRNKGVYHNHHAHHHGRLRTASFSPEAHFSGKEIDSFIDKCLSGTFGELCRVKGILTGEVQPVLINIAMSDANVSNFSGTCVPSLTFIGEHINEDEISKFLNCS